MAETYITVPGAIAEAAAGEIPETWKALTNSARGYPATFFDRRLNGVMRRYLGAVLTPDEQNALDPVVIDYLGKRLALSLIVAGIDYWSKQRIQTGVQGSRNENVTYKDRASDLKDIQKMLLIDVMHLWVEVQPLLPNRRVRQAAVPAVTTETTAYTADPNLMEPPFDNTLIPAWVTGR